MIQALSAQEILVWRLRAQRLIGSRAGGTAAVVRLPVLPAGAFQLISGETTRLPGLAPKMGA
jgi:hypothetical protein